MTRNATADDLWVTGWEAEARAGRHRRLRELMAENGITTLVSTSVDSFAYLTATWCSAYPVVPTRRLFTVISEDEFFAVTSSADPAHLRFKGVDDAVIYGADEGDPGGTLLDELRRRGLLSGSIGLELPELDARLHGQLITGMEGSATVSDGWPTVWRARVVKDAWELEELRRMGTIVADATRLAAARTRAGETELDYARRANDHAVMHEALDGGVLVMGSGPRAGIHHSEPTTRKLEPGDIVRVDLSRRGPIGYYGDIGRTMFVGEPSASQLERFNVTAAGLTAIEEALVPGARIGDAALACQQVYRDAGYDMGFRLHGHSLGLTLHEDPVIEPDCDIVCEPNMVFAAEAVLKIGLDERTLTHAEQYHLESLVHVTETGNEIFAAAGTDVVTIPVS
jgi:Xaa-Pro aminopeptidase